MEQKNHFILLFQFQAPDVAGEGRLSVHRESEPGPDIRQHWQPWGGSGCSDAGDGLWPEDWLERRSQESDHLHLGPGEISNLSPHSTFNLILFPRPSYFLPIVSPVAALAGLGVNNCWYEISQHYDVSSLSRYGLKYYRDNLTICHLTSCVASSTILLSLVYKGSKQSVCLFIYCFPIFSILQIRFWFQC